MQMCTFSLRKMGEVKDKTRKERMRGGETAVLSYGISILFATLKESSNSITYKINKHLLVHCKFILLYSQISTKPNIGGRVGRKGRGLTMFTRAEEESINLL